MFQAKGSTADLAIGAAAGAARVRLDDVRVVETTRPAAGLVDDFEHVDQGWGPFVKGDAGGVTDPRTVLVPKHAPYTQAGWNGKLVDDVLDGNWSLKSHEENEGLVYRTAPWTVNFQPGHKYKVSFDYESGRAGQYAWVQGVDRPASVEVKSTPIGEQRTKATFNQEFVAGCGGDYWVGLRKLSAGGDQSDFIMDNFAVTDLGTTSRSRRTVLRSAVSGLNGLVSGEANTVDHHVHQQRCGGRQQHHVGPDRTGRLDRHRDHAGDPRDRCRRHQCDDYAGTSLPRPVRRRASTR